MLLIFMAFLHVIISGQKQESVEKYSPIKTILYFTGGVTALLFGSDILVNNAIIIAKDLGVSERVIGLSLVAVGTSLPELVTSVVAAFKKEYAISVGNIIGSNVFNIFFVLGTAIAIKPTFIDLQLLEIDIPVMILFVLFLLPFIFRERIGRIPGIILLTVYAAYMVSLFG